MPRPLLPVTDWFDAAPSASLAGSRLQRRCKECDAIVDDITAHVLEHALRDPGYARPRAAVDPKSMPDSERLRLLRQLDYFTRAASARAARSSG